MPHAVFVPNSGLQAVILCGPGVSLNTFTSKPEVLPKALVPIANRPMIWYPLEWCYRMGITCTLAFITLDELFEFLMKTSHGWQAGLWQGSGLKAVV